MKVVIVTPGTNASYEIPVIKSQNYTINEIFEKNLLFLIPFYIFTYENRFEEYNKDMSKIELLKTEYEDIKNKLEELMNRNVINEYTRCTISDMSNKVLEHIAKKYKNVREGVKSVMGGKVLEYEAKTIRNEGRLEGRLEGKLELLSDFVQNNIITIDDAAKRLNLTKEEFETKMQEYQSSL